MIETTGNMLSTLDDADLFCITTNSYINKDRQLVMGRGIALEMKRLVPGIAALAGETLLGAGGAVGQCSLRYGLAVVQPPSIDTKIGLFQVKYHFRDNADLELIEHSVAALSAVAGNYRQIELNYPGIGWGGLDRAAVAPLLAELPDNVRVWSFPDGQVRK